MTLEFDANQVNITTKKEDYFRVEVETRYPNEVINNFTPQDIIDNYEKIDELYKLLKEDF